MDIQKTSIHPSNIATLQRPSKAPTVSQNESKPLESGVQSTKSSFSPSEIKSAISQLDKQQTSDHKQLPKPFSLSNRAQQALNAYSAQQNLPQQESRAHIQQILGVDYYA